MNPQIGRKGKYLKRPAVRKAGAKTPPACPARRQERLDPPPAPGGRGGRLADGAGGSLPPPLPDSRLPASARAARYSLPLGEVGFLRLPRPPPPRGGAGSAARGDQQPIGGIGRGKRGAQLPAPSASRRRGPRGVSAAPALRPAERDSGLGPRSPLKHLLWRLETEFENPPISGGWRSGPGQSRGCTARALRPSESWRSWARVSPSPAQLLPPRPPPPSGYLETSRPGANSCRGRGPRGRGKPRWGRREEVPGRRALLLRAKDPLSCPRLAARGDRGHSPGRGEQMGFGKRYTPSGCCRRHPFLPPQPARGSEIVQACWGKRPNAKADATREPWLPLSAASRWLAS